jgi:hypothetical protein
VELEKMHPLFEKHQAEFEERLAQVGEWTQILRLIQILRLTRSKNLIR